jgi:hypothetical protein
MRDALDTYPGLSSPPWKILDPKRHLDLIANLIAYGAGPVPILRNKQRINPIQLKGPVEAFIRTGGELKVWRTHLITYYEPGRRLAPTGQQTILEMIDKRYPAKHPKTGCSGNQEKGWLRYTFLVSPSLTGPDMRMDLSFADLLANSYPMILNQEQTVLVSYPVNFDYNTASVSSTTLGGGLCRFKFLNSGNSRQVGE